MKKIQFWLQKNILKLQKQEMVHTFAFFLFLMLYEFAEIILCKFLETSK